MVSVAGCLFPNVSFISFLAKERRGIGIQLFGFHLTHFQDGVNQVAFHRGKLC